MKILAIEREVPGVADDAFGPHLQAEARRAWDLHQAGVIRDLHFRTDWPGAVLILECSDIAEAERALATLPLVEMGLIAFDIIPLAPYPRFARLFAEGA